MYILSDVVTADMKINLNMNKKRILILHTGGTFGMMPTDPDQILAPGSLQKELINQVPELKKIAELTLEIPFNLDSSNIGIGQWEILGESINRQYNEFDGFVIIHGTDTMVYSAAALSFSFQNLTKPIIFTGAQIPLTQLRSDGRNNLIDAVELATMALPETAIVFGSKILRGNRAKKISITRYEAFDSPNYPRLGEVGLKIRLYASNLWQPSGKTEYRPGFSARVGVIAVQPSLPTFAVRSFLDSGLKALILTGFGAGNLPSVEPNWIDFIREATDRGLAVIIGSSSPHGNTDLSLYECGQSAMQAGAVDQGNMTFEAAYVKLLKILARTEKRELIIDQFQQNWSGERS